MAATPEARPIRQSYDVVVVGVRPERPGGGHHAGTDRPLGPLDRGIGDDRRRHTHGRVDLTGLPARRLLGRASLRDGLAVPEDAPAGRARARAGPPPCPAGPSARRRPDGGPRAIDRGDRPSLGADAGAYRRLMDPFVGIGRRALRRSHRAARSRPAIPSWRPGSGCEPSSRRPAWRGGGSTMSPRKP